MKITIAQINPTIGDVEKNFDKIELAIEKGIKDNSDLIVFPEMSILGFPPFDLLNRKNIKEKIENSIEKILRKNYPIGILIGSPYYTSHGIYNSAYLFYKNTLSRVDKFLLAKDPLLQNLYFQCGNPEFIEFNNHKIGIFIGDDLLQCDNIVSLKEYLYQVDLIIMLSSSFYYLGKRKEKIEKVKNIAKNFNKKIIYVNQVGGNGELIFEGGSFIISEKGDLIFESKIFEEDITTINLENLSLNSYKEEDISFIYNGLVLGVRDYFRKSGFEKAVIGLSGGIDSAVVACIAKEALREEKVLGVSMPSIYTSKESIEDAKELSKNLNINFRIVSIKDIFYSYLKELNPSPSPIMDIAEENLQSRIRGNLLMFISNRENYIVLATGNRSEALTGYCTLYGDTAGSLEVIGDIYKTTVYKLAEYINKESEIIPKNIIMKAPSAELRPNQKDEDSLPPYSILDPILTAYVDENKSEEEIINLGFPKDIVRSVIEKVEKSEYKRRQIPPVLRIRSKNPLRERILPLVYKII
jgi:NAD+ synthase (glutamine-hydrolysing)